MKQDTIIIKGVGSFYELLDQGRIITCKARGSFRRAGLTPLVGDRVLYQSFERGYSQITQILPRKNALLRPACANIDRLFIVLSAGSPAPDFLLADKLIWQARSLAIEPILLLNKVDCARADILEQFERDYAPFTRLRLSALEGKGLEPLKALIEGCVCCFAGQSAVGKTSLLNALLPELALPVGELSEKTERGRHTTRHAQLYPCFGGALLDTPGFSLYESEELEAQKLQACYPEFEQAAPCRFKGCLHVSEPDCGVKALLEEGKLSKERYKRYTLLMEDLLFRRKHRYD